jgi:hypothetical protein
MNCPSPIYTQSEQASQNSGFLATSWIRTILSGIQLINLMVQNPVRKNKLVTIIVVSGLLPSAWDAIQRSIVTDPSRLTCASRTAWHTMRLGSHTTETGTNALLSRNCDVYALLNLYTSFIIYWCALSIFIELWLHVVLNTQHLPSYRKIYFFLGLLLAVGNALLVNLYGNPKMVVLGAFTTECQYSTGDQLLDFYLNYMPHFGAYMIALILGGHVLYICAHRAVVMGLSHEDHPLVKLWKVNSILFYYLLLFIGAYGPVDIWLGYWLTVIDGTRMKDSFVDWIQCVFNNFVTPEDQPIVDSICGKVPAYRITSQQTIGLVILQLLYYIFLTLVTLDKDSMDFWNVCFRAVYDCLHGQPIKFHVQDSLAIYENDEDDEDETKGKSIGPASVRLDYSMYSSYSEEMKNGAKYEKEEPIIVRLSKEATRGRRKTSLSSQEDDFF